MGEHRAEGDKLSGVAAGLGLLLCVAIGIILLILVLVNNI